MMNRSLATFFWISMGLASVPGLVLLYMKYVLEPTDPYSVVNHPWQPTVLHTHIVLAPLLIFVVGILTVSHIVPRFDSTISDGRKGGITLALLFWPMVVSGYLTQVASSPSFRTTLAWTHIISSCAFIILMFGHFISGRRYRARQR